MFELLIYENKHDEHHWFTDHLVFWENIGGVSDQFTMPVASREKNEYLLRKISKEKYVQHLHKK